LNKLNQVRLPGIRAASVEFPELWGNPDGIVFSMTLYRGSGTGIKFEVT